MRVGCESTESVDTTLHIMLGQGSDSGLVETAVILCGWSSKSGHKMMNKVSKI